MKIEENQISLSPEEQKQNSRKNLMQKSSMPFLKKQYGVISAGISPSNDHRGTAASLYKAGKSKYQSSLKQYVTVKNKSSYSQINKDGSANQHIIGMMASTTRRIAASIDRTEHEKSSPFDLVFKRNASVTNTRFYQMQPKFSQLPYLSQQNL